MNPLLEALLYRAVVVFAMSFGRLPPAVGARIGAALGRLYGRCSRRYRGIAAGNLRRAYPEKSDPEIRGMVRGVFENIGRILHEICWTACLENEAVCRLVRIEGIAHIRSAWKKGKGVLVLTAHIGNWEMLPAVGKRIGYPANAVYRPLDAAPLERFSKDQRSRFGMRVIPKKRAFRKILKRLDNREMIGVLMDQNVAVREGVFAPFFGIPACTNKGLALLALKTGAPVVPIFVIRAEKGYRGLVMPEIPLVRTGDRIKDIEANTAAYNRVIESVVRRYPEQWFWVHRRWNTRPYSPWPGSGESPPAPTPKPERRMRPHAQ